MNPLVVLAVPQSFHRQRHVRRSRAPNPVRISFEFFFVLNMLHALGERIVATGSTYE